EPMIYAFAMPKIERQRIPDRPKVLSDESHTAQSPAKAPNPKNDAPFNRQLAEPVPSERPGAADDAGRDDGEERALAESDPPEPIDRPADRRNQERGEVLAGCDAAEHAGQRR